MNIQTTPDRKHRDAAGYFFDCLLSTAKISQHDKLSAISSALVTLADAATICGISAQELWFNYVRLGILRMYNGDVPAEDFIRVTILLQNVMAFFCEQERIRRLYEQSYQNTVKYMIMYGIKSEDYKNEIIQWLSRYFSLPQSEAINFESCIIALSRFFVLRPINTIDANCSLTNTLNSSNNITNANNITIENNSNGMEQVLAGLVEIVRTLSAGYNTSPPQEPSAGQESPSANGGQKEADVPQLQATVWKEEAKKRTGAERKACLLASAKWEGLDHIEAHKRIASEPCTDESRKAYVAKAKKTARQMADSSEGRLIMPSWRQR